MRVAAGSRRMVALALVLAFVAAMSSAVTADAAYPGRNGVIAYERLIFDEGGDVVSAYTEDAILAGSIVLTRCRGETLQPDRGIIVPPCYLGRPSYSPDGASVVFSKLLPTNAAEGAGVQGTLALMSVSGRGMRSLARQTAEDLHPAFMPSGNNIVFDGRRTASSPANLYMVGTDGTGLRQLTFSGGSEPAPCANGTVAFVKDGRIHLLARGLRAQRRVSALRGHDPDCSPNSRTIAFAHRGSVYTVATSGGRPHQIASASLRMTANGVGLSNGRVDGVAFSPDGQTIVFLGHYLGDAPLGDYYELEFVDLRGRRARRPRLILDVGAGFYENYHGSVAGITWQPKPQLLVRAHAARIDQRHPR